MSWTFSFDQELVGLFAGVPVFRPLVEVPGESRSPFAFACHPGQLVIGAGDDIEPALVVLRPDVAAKHYVDAHLDRLRGPRPDLVAGVEASPQYGALPAGANPWGEVFRFAGWEVEHYRDFLARCSSRGMHRPYDPARGDNQFEEWLSVSIGEFVFRSLPELLPLAARGLELPYHSDYTQMYLNVLLIPPGYDPWFGESRLPDGTTVRLAHRWRTTRADGAPH